jgi:hypothetical protein
LSLLKKKGAERALQKEIANRKLLPQVSTVFSFLRMQSTGKPFPAKLQDIEPQLR